MSGIAVPEGAPIASKAAPSGPTGAAWPDLPGKDHCPLFERLTSPASTAVPGSPLFARAFSEESYGGLGFSLLEAPTLSLDSLEERLEEIKALYEEKLGENVDSEADDEQVERDEDGTPWIATVGADVHRRLDFPDTRVDELEANLAEVKQIYAQKFGKDAYTDSEEDQEARADMLAAGVVEVKELYFQKFGEDVDADPEEEQEMRDEDGTLYILTVGADDWRRSEAQETRLDALTACLGQVKQLYLERFGEDVDTYSEEDHEARVDTLTNSLAEVKQLYRDKFGEDVDADPEDDQVMQDEDGTPYILTVGTHETRLDALAVGLAEVKELYLEKFGEDVDTESDEDHEARVDALAASLSEVKQLYVERFGEDVDADSAEEHKARVDALAASLAEVKQLYSEKFAEDVDADSEDREVCDEDGALYVLTVGVHETCLHALTTSLAEVKQLYFEKFGEGVDADSGEGREMRDEEGTLYVLTSGADGRRHEIRVEALMASLAEVKQLYLEKFGEDVDADSEEDREARVDALAASLSEVKQLYLEKFGEDADADSEDDRELRDEDGALYVLTVGPPETRLDELTASLAEVKQMYLEKFGADVDADSEKDREERLDALMAEVKQLYEQKFGEDVHADSEDDRDMRDEDGALYVLIGGVHETRLDVLAAGLAEVKQLYLEKFGEAVDADSEEEHEARVNALAGSLAEVRQLYFDRFGEDVDADSEEDREMRDEDGALYVTIGAEVFETHISMLAASLAEVKQLYEQKFGEAVDADSEEDHEARVSALAGSLAEVKQLYFDRFGEDFDADSEEDREMCGEDGALYVVTTGADVRETRIDALTASLADVKQLYLEKFGEDVDVDSETDREERLDALMASLAEAKQLYARKFGEDVDADSEDDREMRDEDGALYVLTVGAHETRLDALAASMAEVKQLYLEKFGEDADANSEEDEDAPEDDDMPWTIMAGTDLQRQSDPSETRLARLTASLAKVKQLYEQRYGTDVDADFGEDQEVLDDDGAPWIMVVGDGVESDAKETRMATLTPSLAEVTRLYERKYGKDVEADTAEDQDQDQEMRDVDGTPWIVVAGSGIQWQPDAGETYMAALTASLAEVKQLYRQKYGEGVDDEDGMLYMLTFSSAGVQRLPEDEARAEALATSLAEAKALYRHKYGQDADADSDDEEDRELLDADGARWVRTVGCDLQQ